jgi:hypothetical protein
MKLEKLWYKEMDLKENKRNKPGLLYACLPLLAYIERSRWSLAL